MKMLYDKQDGCFKEFDDKRYLIVDVSKYDKLYIHHDKDGGVYESDSPTLNSRFSCIEYFNRNGVDLKRLGLINLDTGYILLFSTKKVSKLKKAFDKVADNRHITYTELEFSDRLISTYKVSEVESFIRNTPHTGYIHMHIISDGHKVAEGCFYKDFVGSVKFESLKSYITFFNGYISDIFEMCSKFDK